MTTRQLLLISSVFLLGAIHSQSITGVYKIGDLLKRINNPDTVYVVNFWATWCKPCVQELPAFDSLTISSRTTNVKVLLVSIDFKEEMGGKVNPFVAARNILSECVLLDEVNGNDFINKISPDWSGAIPATLFKKGSVKFLKEKKMNLNDLRLQLKKLN